MTESKELGVYQAAIRRVVCDTCRVRPDGGPPCEPLGQPCGFERHLSKLVEVCHTTDNCLIGPYVDRIYEEVCASCEHQSTEQCPCPMQQLLPLAVRAIEEVDRHRNMEYGGSWTEH